MDAKGEFSNSSAQIFSAIGREIFALLGVLSQGDSKQPKALRIVLRRPGSPENKQIENSYKNVREKATPPTQSEMFADVVHNEAFEGDENEMNEKTENKCADL